MCVFVLQRTCHWCSIWRNLSQAHGISNTLGHIGVCGGHPGCLSNGTFLSLAKSSRKCQINPRIRTRVQTCKQRGNSHDMTWIKKSRYKTWYYMNKITNWNNSGGNYIHVCLIESCNNITLTVIELTILYLIVNINVQCVHTSV